MWTTKNPRFFLRWSKLKSQLPDLDFKETRYFMHPLKPNKLSAKIGWYSCIYLDYVPNECIWQILLMLFFVKYTNRISLYPDFEDRPRQLLGS